MVTLSIFWSLFPSSACPQSPLLAVGAWYEKNILKQSGAWEIQISLIFASIRPGSDAVLYMSRIECKWGRTKDFAHLHSIRLMWTTASELGLKFMSLFMSFVSSVQRTKRFQRLTSDVPAIANALRTFSKAPRRWNQSQAFPCWWPSQDGGKMSKTWARFQVKCNKLYLSNVYLG